MDNEKNKVELTKSQLAELNKKADEMQEFFGQLSSPEAKTVGDELASDMRKLLKNGKMMPIDMADGTTFYMDTTGMKSSEIEEFKQGIFEFVNGEMVMHDSAHRTKKTKADKSKPQKSSKIK